MLYFRLDYTIRELILPPGAVHTFRYRAPREIVVTLRPPSADEQSKGHNAANAFCSASSAIEPTPKNLDVFERIAANQVVLGDDSDVAGEYLEYEAPDGSCIRVPELSEFDESFQSFIRGLRRELSESARRTVSVLRWRVNHVGLHDPISFRGLYWSVDGVFFHPAPADFGVRVEFRSTVRLREELRAEIENTVNAGESEPLHHDLFREAWQQRHENPRSALVIGMAAAELSMKHCIGALVPPAEWLTFNLPAPPLARMLSEYLPRLPVRCKIAGQAKAPPRAVVEAITKGVTIRNRIVHSEPSDPTGDTVEEILEAVQDVLWLLDYYTGREWAAAFLRPETRKELLEEPE